MVDTPHIASSTGRGVPCEPESWGLDRLSSRTVSRLPSTAHDACKAAVQLRINTITLGAGGIHTSCPASVVLHLALSCYDAAQKWIVQRGGGHFVDFIRDLVRTI